MTAPTRSLILITGALALVLVLAAGCTVAGPVGPPYYGDPAADYYEPYGVDYGFWGPGYGVGPYHDHDHRGHFWHGHGFHRGFHGGHGMPTLPGGHGFHGGGHGR